MFGLRLPELLLIAAVLLVLFGANKLPQLGKGMGESIKSFRDAVKDLKVDEKERVAGDAEKKTT